ncbi:MAG TPA: hypothetical protein VNH17_14965, partial [Streptosporangiaceae bacterium]|nr:hypothetical protein [Streptosporangiaceae bacterium]
MRRAAAAGRGGLLCSGRGVVVARPAWLGEVRGLGYQPVTRLTALGWRDSSFGGRLAAGPGAVAYWRAGLGWRLSRLSSVRRPVAMAYRSAGLGWRPGRLRRVCPAGHQAVAWFPTMPGCAGLACTGLACTGLACTGRCRGARGVLGAGADATPPPARAGLARRAGARGRWLRGPTLAHGGIRRVVRPMAGFLA